MKVGEIWKLKYCYLHDGSNNEMKTFRVKITHVGSGMIFDEDGPLVGDRVVAEPIECVMEEESKDEDNLVEFFMSDTINLSREDFLDYYEKEY